MKHIGIDHHKHCNFADRNIFWMAGYASRPPHLLHLEVSGLDNMPVSLVK